MTINNTNLDAIRIQQLQGQQTTYPGQVNLDNENLFADGLSDIYGADLATTEADYLAAAEAAGITATEEVDETEDSEEAKKIKEEIEKLEEEKQENIEKMEKIEAEIEQLAEEAEQAIMDAVAIQEAAVKEHEEETKAALDENIQAYINANKEGGEGMTRDELQANIKNSLPNTPEIADAVAKLTAASELVNEIDSCLGELNNLILDTQAIDAEIDVKQGEYDAVKEAEKQAECNPQPCEPQGFQDNEGNQYDFFIDKDGNGDLSNETEFLGYEGGKEGQAAAWAEMTDLDTNMDGIVDAEELTAGGVMVYKTDENGNQQAMTIEEAFGEDSDLAISTTQHDEAKEGVGPKNFNEGEGSENNELWGTFDVTLNGESLNGYQTNDDLEWLKNNYNFTDYANGEEVTEETEGIQYSEELQPHVDFYEIYTEKSQDLKEQIAEGFENIGLTEEQIDGINQATKKEADENAEDFLASLDVEDEEDATLTTDETENEGNEDEEGKPAEGETPVDQNSDPVEQGTPDVQDPELGTPVDAENPDEFLEELAA